MGSGGERKEGVVCMITKEEVKRSLKKVGKNKAPGLSGVTAEMILVEEDLSVEWLVEVINGIVKEGHIPSIFQGIIYSYRCIRERGIHWIADRIEV